MELTLLLMEARSSSRKCSILHDQALCIVLNLNLILSPKPPSRFSITLHDDRICLRILHKVRYARRAMLLATDVVVRDRKLWHSQFLYMLEHSFILPIFIRVPQSCECTSELQKNLGWTIGLESQMVVVRKEDGSS